MLDVANPESFVATAIADARQDFDRYYPTTHLKSLHGIGVYGKAYRDEWIRLMSEVCHGNR